MAKTQAELLKDGIITEADLSTDSVVESKIKNKAVTREKLEDKIKPTPFTTRGFNLPI
jgi:hypothetical protein